MPVRSLNSPVLVWPKRAEVEELLRRWVGTEAEQHPGLMRLGCFGSFGRDDWGVGSDLDLVAVIRSSDKPFERQALGLGPEQVARADRIAGLHARGMGTSAAAISTAGRHNGA